MNAVADPPRRVATPQELVDKAIDGIYEMIDGRAVPKWLGARTSRCAAELCGRLAEFGQARDLGEFFGADAGFQCWDDDPTRVRKPDVAFVKRSRLAADALPPGFLRIAPDLAVEVISPMDRYSDMQRRINEYLRAGVQLVWVIDPDTRFAHVHRNNGSMSYVGEDGELDGEDVLPGFRCKLADVLPPKPASQERRP